MRETLIVSSRGQVTLPVGMRKHLGIAPGSAVIIEERDGELTLAAQLGECETRTDALVGQEAVAVADLDRTRLQRLLHVAKPQPNS